MKTCPRCGYSEEESQLVLSGGESRTAAAWLPLVSGKEYPVDQAVMEAWQIAYPGISVSAELAKMRAWLLSNPKKGKTASGIARFANTWLSKAQDQVGNGNGRRNGNYGYEAEREQINRVLRQPR